MLSGYAIQRFTDHHNVPSTIRNGGMKADLHELALSVLKTVLRNSINLQVDWILRSLNDHANAIYSIIDWGSPAFFRSYFGSPYFELLCEFQQPQVTQVLFPLRLVSI